VTFRKAAGEFKQGRQAQAPTDAGFLMGTSGSPCFERLGKKRMKPKMLMKRRWSLIPKLDETRQMLDDLKNKPQAKADKSFRRSRRETAILTKQEASPHPRSRAILAPEQASGFPYGSSHRKSAVLYFGVIRQRAKSGARAGAMVKGWSRAARRRRLR